MSGARLIGQVLLIGSTIVGKAFSEAWKQAARNARAGGEAATGVAGGAARGGNVDALTRNHGMTFDEAANILNVKRGAIQAGEETELQRMLKNFDHLFQANSPLTAEGKPHSSHYLQSKIVRAKERLEAELAAAAKGAGEAAAAEAPKTPGGSA
ncbi:mitochondrial import inner membrane translocase subunit TIM16 [Rhodotorula toruloides]